MRRKITLTLIHNNNQFRNELIIPNLLKLKKELAVKNDVIFNLIGKQPIIIEHNISLVIFRKFLYWKINREWNEYRLIDNEFILYSIKNLFTEILKIIGSKTKEISHLKKNSFIETLVSDKHIRAWNTAYENESDLLICFEDDAIFLDDSIKLLLNVIDEIIMLDNIPMLYIDLAGGCNINDLKIDKLELKKGKKVRYYSKPVTNTACGYLVSKPLLDEFIFNIICNPWIRLIGIDWMINKIFIICKDKKIICAHAEPHIFSHGTQDGFFQSWLKR